MKHRVKMCVKVVQINTIYKYKSTGRTCWEVEKAIESDGGKSLTIHQSGDNSDPEKSYVVNNRLAYYFHKLMSRVTGLEGYYSYFGTKKAIERIKEFNPDIIHLRNLHGGYLNLKLLFNFLVEYDKPVIYNLHDTWAYTGKCPEYENSGCNKWKSECGNCPNWKGYPRSWFFDRTRKMFRDKKKWYSGIKNLTVIGVSDYMAEESRHSVLFKGRDVERIYNWVDLEKFHPYDKIQCQKIRKKYGLGDGFLILGVSSYWKKNTEYQEICELAKKMGRDAQVCLVGGTDVKTPYSNMHHIANTDSITLLAQLYSTADAFVSLSTAESFGKVAAESLACGTPAVVYSTTGIKEIPGEGCGYAVKKHDLNAMKECLLQIKENGKATYTKACRDRAEKLFNYDINTEQLLSLYKKIIKRNQQNV